MKWSIHNTSMILRGNSKSLGTHTTPHTTIPQPLRNHSTTPPPPPHSPSSPSPSSHLFPTDEVCTQRNVRLHAQVVGVAGIVPDAHIQHLQQCVCVHVNKHVMSCDVMSCSTD